MTTAVPASDNSETLVGSSLVWASGRVGPGLSSYTSIMAAVTASNFCPQPGFGRHGRLRGDPSRPIAHWWLSRRKSRPDLPNDSFSAEGYQGQLLLVAPYQRAVVVRLGQTPKKPGFDANAFGADVPSALR